MTLTQQLIELIRAKPISASDRQRSAFLVLDALANAMAGRNSMPGDILLRWSREQGGDAGRRAFVMGGLTHILETDDLHRASVTHPGCVVVPATIATARGKSLSGKALLDAVLHGFEAMCRVGNSVGPTHYEIWHNTATCGPYGSAMACASLDGLSAEQTMHALGNAGTQSSGLWQFLETGAMSKHLHAGRAAESGVIAAQLAAIDFTGPPAILEGGQGFFAAACPDAEPQAVIENPEDPWQLGQTSIKPWPSCRHTHPAVDAALEVQSKIDGHGIDRVVVETYPAALKVCDRPRPESEYEAKFSLYHTVAAALTDGRLGFDSFGPDSRAALAPLRDRISITAGEPFASSYPQSWGAKVSVVTTDGSKFSAVRDGALGDPERPLDDEQMIEKAGTLLAYAGLDEPAAGRLIASILDLAEQADCDRLIEDLHDEFF